MKKNPDKNHLRQLWKRKAGRPALESEKTITAGERREGEGIGSEHDGGLLYQNPRRLPTS